MDGENRIRVQFMGEKQPVSAKVLDECFDIDRDVAILQVDEVPAGIAPLRLGRASESRRKNDLYTYGYAIAAGEQGVGGLGTFIRQDGNFVQFRMHEADHGHSGAPLYDDNRGVVVGMVKKGKDTPGRSAETTYAISTETIWQVCPQLKPPLTPNRNLMVEGINLLPYDYDQRIENFLAEYLGSEKQPMPFGGRDNALHILDDWLAGSTPYLMLAAPAGRGKSALLVRWLDGLKAREELALAFVPISIRFGTNMGRVLYSSLAARLAFLHGESVPTNPETSTDIYRGLVSNYLSKPLMDGRRLLVIIDGLDEASDWKAGEDFLPSQLPAGVHVAVSARFLAGDDDAAAWLDRLNWGKNRAIAPGLGLLSQAGLTDVLEKMGCPLDELSRDVDIVSAIYHLSEGDPLLVRLYMDDLWSRGEAVTLLKPKDLAGIQPGYKGYFDKWWEHQKTLWGREKKTWMEAHVRIVRKLLAGALSPLKMDDIQALDPELQSDDIRDALDELKRFVIGSNQTQGYTFSHPKLGQYFWDELTIAEREQVEKLFLAWGKRTLQEFISGERNSQKKAEVPAYIVRNYTTHLINAEKPIDEWLPLIHHRAWAQVWLTVEGAYGGYLQDVQRVWELCKALDREMIAASGSVHRLGEQIRCGLIEASLHSLAGNIPSNLIPVLVQEGLWTVAQAWVSIRQIPSDEKKAETIIYLLGCLHDTQLSVALAVAKEISESHRGKVLSALAQRLPETALGDVFASAKEIESEWDRATVLSTLAQRLPDTALSDVFASAKEIGSERHRATVLRVLSQRLPETVLGEVLIAAREIRSAGYRAMVLIDLSQRLPEVAEEALLTAWDVEYSKWSWPSAEMLIDLAQRLPELAGKAFAAAQQDGVSESSRATKLIDLAKHLPETTLDEVLATARGIGDNDYRAEVLSVLAQCLPEVAGEALAAAREIRSAGYRAVVLSVLAQCLPEIAEEALAATQKPEDFAEEEYRSHVLRDLAERLPETALGQVLGVARGLDKANCSYVLSALAQRLPETELGQMLTAVSELDSDGSRAIVLRDLSKHQPKAALGQVLTATRELRDAKDRVKVLSVLAERLPELAEEALSTAREIGDIVDHADVLIVLTQYLVEVADEALTAAREIRNKSKSKYAEALSALVPRLPETALGQVLAATQEIGDEWYRIKVLSVLAQRLPEIELRQMLAVALKIRDERNRAKMLSALVPRLLETELGQVLATARGIGDNEYRAEVLSALYQRLPELADEALTAAREIRNERGHAEALSTLIPRLPETALDDVLIAVRKIADKEYRAEVLSVLAQRRPEIVDEVLSATLEIRNEWRRAKILSTLAQSLPVPALGKLLAAAKEVGVAKHRAEILSTLAQRLPEIVDEVLTVAREVGNAKDCAEILSSLVPLLMNISKKELYEHIEINISQLSQRTREDIFSGISILLPVFLYLGADGLDREILQATRDVSAWWP